MSDGPPFNSTADLVRSYLCELGPGDHGHTDCWHLSTAADIIESRDDYTRRSAPTVCQCGRRLKSHPNHPEVIGHPGRCEFGEPYFDGTRIGSDPSHV